MVEKPLFCQPFIFSARPAVIAIRVNADSAARGENAGYFYVFGGHQADEVFHDDIDTILMKGPVIAETEQIQFQALAFHHFYIGNIIDVDGGEIRLAGDRTEAGKFRTVEAHPVIIVRCLLVNASNTSGA